MFFLSEHVTDFRTEAGKGHGICILVRKAEIAQAHSEAGGMLPEFIPPAIFRIGSGNDRKFNACRIFCIENWHLGLYNLRDNDARRL